MSIKLQLALDLGDLEAACQVAAQVVDIVDRIEVGTPLLRSYGVFPVRLLRTYFPKAVIVADCKVMDGGSAETTQALDAGANGVIVQTAAPRATIIASCRAAVKRGGFVMADCLGVDDVASIRAKVHDLPVANVIVHRGKDEQESSRLLPVAEAHDVGSAVDLPPLAIAGGVSVENIGTLVDISRLDIVIVGNAIVASDSPRRVASELKMKCNS